MMILRGLSGLIIGVAYGVLMGAFTFLAWRLTSDPAHPGPMIPNNNEWGRIVTFFVTMIAGVLGALVGLVVSLTRLDKARGALIGGAVGLIVFVLYAAKLWSDFTKMSTRDLSTALAITAIFFVCLPIGLGLVGMMASIIANKMKP